MRKSAKKQQSQIQRTVTSRNVTQDNGNINNFWKVSISESKNCCMENYICVRVFKRRPVPTDQVFCTRCMLRLLRALPIPTNSAAQANSTKHIVDYHVLFQTRTHLHLHKCEDVYKIPLLKEIV